MKNHELIVTNDMELNFRRNFKVCKFRELLDPDYKNLFSPRGFGILLWAAHDQLIFYKNNYRKIIRFFVNLSLAKNQLLYLLENLQLTFNKSFFPYLPGEENDLTLNYCLDYISIECGKLTRRLNTDIYRPYHLLDFRFIKRNLELIPRVYDRIKYLVNIKTDYSQYEHSLDSSIHSSFINNCEYELNRYLEPKEYEKYLLPSLTPGILIPEESPVRSAEYISKFIIGKINSVDASRWRYVFSSQQDFQFFVQLLTGFFTGKTIDLNFTLKLNDRCKTRLCPILNSIYDTFELTPLRTNTVFLSLLKNLSIFKGQSDFKNCQDIKKSKDI